MDVRSIIKRNKRKLCEVKSKFVSLKLTTRILGRFFFLSVFEFSFFGKLLKIYVKSTDIRYKYFKIKFFQ